jgi:hypothetical protein
MAKKPSALRAKLLTLLENWLESDEGEPLSPNIRRLFEIAVRGLKDLDHGEVPEIFQPKQAKRKGSRPAEVRSLELWAMRHQAALVRNKFTNKTTARHEVAAAYGRSIEALKVWHKNLRSEPPATPGYGNELFNFLAEDARIERAHRKLGLPTPSADHILELARRHGKRYRQLRPKKD